MDTESIVRTQFLAIEYESQFDTDIERKALQKFCVKYQQTRLTFNDFVRVLSPKPSELSISSQSTAIDIIDKSVKNVILEDQPSEPVSIQTKPLTQSTVKSLIFRDLDEPQLPPHIIHMATHGHHNWYLHGKKQEFQIEFEEPHTLIQLVDEHPKFSAYYAAIAVLFEMEISHFVKYGISNKWSKEKKRDEIKTSMPRDPVELDSEKYPLLTNRKIYKLLQTICNRFGCHCRINIPLQNVEIFWGQKNRNGEWEDPRMLLSTYYFRELYSADVAVQEVLETVKKQYGQRLMLCQTLKVQGHAHFVWEIMCVTLNCVLNMDDAYPDDVDDTQWIDEEKKEAEDDDELDSDYESDSDNKEEDEEKTTTIKIKEIQQLTYALWLEWDTSPTSPRRGQSNSLSKLSKAKDDVLRALQKDTDIVLNGEFTGPMAHIHILRFDNVSSAQSAKNKCKEIRQQDRFWDYQIDLQPIDAAPRKIRRYVGQIKDTQRKVFNIDIRRERDPISTILKEKLSLREFKMRLVVLNSCHSYILGRKMSEYAENVICTSPYVEILDKMAVRFTIEFYDTLRRINDEKTPISQLALKALQWTKHCIRNEVKEKMIHRHKCQHHSHCNPSDEQRHKALHLGPLGSEKWDDLQQIVESPKNEYAEFRAYRSKMEKSGVLSDEELDLNLHDRCTLKICNVSKAKMAELKQYLSDQLTEEEMKENEITDRKDFVVRSVWRKDDNFEGLSFGYFKFQSRAHRHLGKRKLYAKHQEESRVFSQRVYRGEPWAPKGKENDLAWYYRNVPRCCCSPQHPHRAEDKYMFIHNGHIINRSLFSAKALKQHNIFIPDQIIEEQLQQNVSGLITPMSPRQDSSNSLWRQRSKSKSKSTRWMSSNESLF